MGKMSENRKAAERYLRDLAELQERVLRIEEHLLHTDTTFEPAAQPVDDQVEDDAAAQPVDVDDAAEGILEVEDKSDKASEKTASRPAAKSRRGRAAAAADPE